MSREFDLCVIGAGPGGHAAAEEAAGLGARVAIVEKDKWGGTCAHLGCIPTKALLSCSGHLSALGKLKRLGVSVSGVSHDFSAMKRHQEQMVRVAVLGVQKSLDDVGVARFEGEGNILSPTEIELIRRNGDRERLKTKRILIAWGSEPSTIPGVRMSTRVMNSNGFLCLDRLPSSFIIVGGGSIGVEFACFLAELDVRVVLIELMNQILPYEDGECAAFLAQELEKRGVEIHTSMRILSIQESPGFIRVDAEKGGEPITLQGDSALICPGRKPLLYERQLEKLDIDFAPSGIICDSRLKTGVDGIFALGDVTGGLQLAHRAAAQGRALADYLFGNGDFFYREEAVPSVVYSHPGLARVGLTERKAVQDGLAIEVRRMPYAANIMARSELRGNGFVKAIFSSGRLRGVTIVGEEAGELIASMSLAVAGDMGIRELKKWILPHPSLSELLRF